jgi:hypothetical protein
MRDIIKTSIIGGVAVLALAGCKQENNYPATSVTTEATTTMVVPGPTETMVVPVPGATATVTATPSDTATPAM